MTLLRCFILATLTLGVLPVSACGRSEGGTLHARISTVEVPEGFRTDKARPKDGSMAESPMVLLPKPADRMTWVCSASGAGKPSVCHKG